MYKYQRCSVLYFDMGRRFHDTTGVERLAQHGRLLRLYYIAVATPGYDVSSNK